MNQPERDKGESAQHVEEQSLREVALLALRLGCTAFGGPAAHIAMLREEVVIRRQWITEQHFLDLLGAVNLIPGPNSTEMVIHVGQERAGWRGLLAAGTLFILPAALMTGFLASVYVRYGATPSAHSLMYGIKPVIIAIVLHALWGLLKTAVKGPFLGAVGLAALVLALMGINEVVLVFAAGIGVTLVRNAGRLWKGDPGSLSAWAPVVGLAAPSAATAVGATPFHFGTLFFTFLKIGSVLYGSGYVLLAFLRNDFVTRLGWLTDQQLLDAVAVGQFTPGPVFTTATFVGYLVGGTPGAVLATLGIFLPSFLFVAVVNPWVPRLRSSPWMSGLLDGVNVAAVGLMTAVAWQIGRSAIVDWPTAILALASIVILLRFKPNSVWLVLAGGLFGLTRTFF